MSTKEKTEDKKEEIPVKMAQTPILMDLFKIWQDFSNTRSNYIGLRSIGRDNSREGKQLLSICHSLASQFFDHIQYGWAATKQRINKTELLVNGSDYVEKYGTIQDDYFVIMSHVEPIKRLRESKEDKKEKKHVILDIEDLAIIKTYMNSFMYHSGVLDVEFRFDDEDEKPIMRG